MIFKPLNLNTKMNNINKNLLIPLSLLLCLALFGGCASEQARCKRAIISYLEKNLIQPDSYVGEEWSNFESEKDSTYYPIKYTIMHQYKAKNAFGGYARWEKYFFLTEDFEVVYAIGRNEMLGATLETHKRLASKGLNALKAIEDYSK